MTRRKIKLDFWFFVKAFVLVALCLFIIYPFYTILTKSVFSSKVEGVTLYNFERFFTKKYYYRTLIKMDVAGHIFGVLWLLTIVKMIDDDTYEHAYGNRLNQHLLNDKGCVTFSPT